MNLGLSLKLSNAGQDIQTFQAEDFRFVFSKIYQHLLAKKSFLEFFSQTPNALCIQNSKADKQKVEAEHEQEISYHATPTHKFHY